MDLRRGDVVTVALPGDYGKPRPAVVVQADLFNATHNSVTLLPMTSTIVDAPLFRMTIDPNRRNGLTHVSQIMIDKVITIPREKVGSAVGHLADESLIRVGRALAVWLGIA
ncbi:MAG: type II toxin-antitoxin system PemK/MazF family toxin [Steroidobacteraceae bacterium]